MFMFFVIFLQVWVAVVRNVCPSAVKLTYRAIATEVDKCVINGRIAFDIKNP